ncbi:MAG: HAD family phosphatase [Pirellulaceae bacterium]
MDGLMFNTEELYEYVGGEILRRRGHTLTTDLLNEMMGRPSPISLQIMIDRHGLTDNVSDLERENDQLFDEILPTRLQTMPGLLELLDWLEMRGIAKAITTSSRRAMFDRLMVLSGLLPRFEFSITAEDITHGKPHPQIYDMAADRFGVPTSRMMVLEDSQIGCRAAVAANSFAVAVPGDHSRHHEFVGVRFIADTLHDTRIYAAIESA